MLEFTPVTQVVRKVLTASGECQVDWTFLGLSMPGWVADLVRMLGGVGIVRELAVRADASPHARG